MSLAVGQAVWVPFGSNVIQGIVFRLSDYSPVEKTKEVMGIIVPSPLLSPQQLELAHWVSEYYLAPLFDSAALMLPPGFERRLITFIQIARDVPFPDTSRLTPAQKQVLTFLRESGKMRIEELERKLGKRRAGITIRDLWRSGLIEKSQEMERVKVRPKMASYLRLAVEPAVARREAAHLLEKRSPRQAAVLQFLADKVVPVPISEVGTATGCSAATAAALREKGLIFIERVQRNRDPLASRVFSPSSPPSLSSEQEAVWHQIGDGIEAEVGDRELVYLLQGVTGSGKTEIYLRALAKTVARGKRGIVLVPEIALTSQTIERFASRFPGRVAVLHSGLSLGERFDEWQRIRDGAFDVVIGSRGAIFAPQPDLGLIVIDEEHENTYKQWEQSPRYHAREVALKLSELTGAVVILGSATPDVESFYRASAGRYQLLELHHRIATHGGPSLPEVEVVDMRRELKSGNRSIFSRSLSKAMMSALEAEEQVILFLNRRGAATFIQCRSCGFVLCCNRCDVSLTYHSAEDEVVCHQCNRRSKVPDACPRCGSDRIKFRGIGTQRVAEEITHLFPMVRVLRWDRDVTRGRHSHEEILDDFRSHRADVLIGTQMIAKGLDLPLVTLVGVVSADTILHLPDFRAGERTFQLLSQVLGRAGRSVRGGRAIIQTYTPHNYAITAASKHDYAAFYRQELDYRRGYDNPPFSHLVRLLYTHTNPEMCQREAERTYHLLEEEMISKGIPDASLLGPTPCFIQRVRGRFRWQIIIRGADPAHSLSGVVLPRGWMVDIDPIDLL
jgi:primosomal protein N' (replication factor Y)